MRATGRWIDDHFYVTANSTNLISELRKYC